MSDDITGRLVFSKSGRDRGRAFVVLGIDQGYLLLADGDLRKVNKPKKKNVRHVQPTNIVIEDVIAIINQDKILEDHIVRSCLRRILETEESAGKEV